MFSDIKWSFDSSYTKWEAVGAKEPHSGDPRLYVIRVNGDGLFVLAVRDGYSGILRYVEESPIFTDIGQAKAFAEKAESDRQERIVADLIEKTPKYAKLIEIAKELGELAA